MIWWPFNNVSNYTIFSVKVVTHQWSGDPSIDRLEVLYINIMS